MLLYTLFIGLGFLLSAVAWKFSLSFFQVEQWFLHPYSHKDATLSREVPSFLETLQSYEGLFSNFTHAISAASLIAFFLIHLLVHYFRRREFRNYLLMGESIPSLSLQLVVEQLFLLVFTTTLCWLLFSLFSESLLNGLVHWERSLLESTPFFQELEPVHKMSSTVHVLESGPFSPQTVHSAFAYHGMDTRFISSVHAYMMKQTGETLFVSGTCSAFFHSLLLKMKSNRMRRI